MVKVIDDLMDFIFSGGLWDMIWAILGMALIFGVVIVAAPLYMPVIRLMHHQPERTSGLPPHLLRGILSLVLALLAAYNIHQHAMSPTDIAESLLPFGDYARIGETLANESSPSVLHQIANTFVRELILAYLFILPVIALDLLNGIATLFTREGSQGSGWIASVEDLVSLVSLTIIMSRYDAPYLTLPGKLVFLAMGGNVLELLFYGLLMIALLGLTMMDMFANSFLMASFGFHIAKKIIPVTLEPWQDYVMIALCFAVGLIANIIRSRIEDNVDLEESGTVIGHGFAVLICAMAAACACLLLIRHVL